MKLITHITQAVFSKRAKEMNFLATRLWRIVLRTGEAAFFPRPKDAPTAPRNKELSFLDAR